MYFHQVCPLINREDERAVTTWCKKNNVDLYKDSVGPYILKHDFDLAYDRPLIIKLKALDSNRWQEYYKAYLEGELYKLLDFESSSKQKESGYIPKGTIAKELKATKSWPETEK